MEKEYIICAAIKLKEARKLSTTYSDLSICEIGYRHCDIYERFEGKVSRHPSDQGFFTSKGRFVDRQEAMKIAYLAGQVSLERAIKNKNEVVLIPEFKKIDESHYESRKFVLEGKPVWNQLYSEDLY